MTTQGVVLLNQKGLFMFQNIRLKIVIKKKKLQNLNNWENCALLTDSCSLLNPFFFVFFFRTQKHWLS